MLRASWLLSDAMQYDKHSNGLYLPGHEQPIIVNVTTPAPAPTATDIVKNLVQTQWAAGAKEVGINFRNPAHPENTHFRR